MTTKNIETFKVGQSVTVDLPPWRDACNRKYWGHAFNGKTGVITEVSDSFSFKDDKHIRVAFGEKSVLLWMSEVKSA